MTLAWTLVDLAGSVALLLWGVHMVQTGVQRAFGAKLHGFLAKALHNRFEALLTGIGVTALLQSSTATGLMVTGFAAGGLVDLVPALSVMLGANIGTTLIVQVLSFNVAEVAPALVLVGVILFRRASAGLRDFGRVLIGLGLLLMALHQFVELLTPYENMTSMHSVLVLISTQPLLAVLIAAVLTWAAHSSVAIVLVVMSFAANGAIPPEATFALVLGANLGTAINPVLEGAGADRAAKRLPVGNLVNRIIGVGLVLALLPYIVPWMLKIDPNPAHAVADFHTAFNLVLALLFFPILGPFADLLRRCMPAKVDQDDPAKPVYLDVASRETPVIALAGAAREALRMADLLGTMLVDLRTAFETTNRHQLEATKRLDDVLDRLNNAIDIYVTTLDTESLSEDDHRRLREILLFAANMKHAADIIDKNLGGTASKMIKRGVTLSPPEQAELLAAIDRLVVNLRTAESLFMTRDMHIAHQLAAEKGNFRKMEIAATDAHFERLSSGKVENAANSAMHLDALRDLASVNAQLVAAAAYPVLESKGELLQSRVRQEN